MISLALLLIASGAAVYGLLLMLYRVTLHPLAHIPGSKIAAATKWYEFYFDILKKPGAQYGYEVSRMHDKYGLRSLSSLTCTNKLTTARPNRSH